MMARWDGEVGLYCEAVEPTVIDFNNRGWGRAWVETGAAPQASGTYHSLLSHGNCLFLVDTGVMR